MATEAKQRRQFIIASAQVAAQQAAQAAATPAAPAQTTGIDSRPATPDIAATAGTLAPTVAPAPTPAPVRVTEGSSAASSTPNARAQTTNRSFGLGSTLLVPGGGVYPVVFGDKKSLLGQ
jgi:hypothetical protein